MKFAIVFSNKIEVHIDDICNIKGVGLSFRRNNILYSDLYVEKYNKEELLKNISELVGMDIVSVHDNWDGLRMFANHKKETIDEKKEINEV